MRSHLQEVGAADLISGLPAKRIDAALPTGIGGAGHDIEFWEVRWLRS